MLPRSRITLVLLVAFAAIDVAPARSAVFLVTTTADHSDGACNADCSLRDAVVAANTTAGPDQITVPAGTYMLGGTGGEDLAATGDLDLRE